MLRRRSNEVVSPRYISAKEVLAESLLDAEFRAIWEAQAPARALALLLVKYRAEHGLTQTALARKIGISQPAVARMEIGEHMPTIKTLMKISEALDIEILLDIKPAARPRSWVSPEADNARVVQRVTTANGSELLLAAS
jgi:transcriptional regulator with XRE-family HTH domain